MNNTKEILTLPFKAVLAGYPYAKDFFPSLGIPLSDYGMSIRSVLDAVEDEKFEEIGVDRREAEERFISFIERMEELGRKKSTSLKSLTINGGRDKSGEPENFTLELCPGDVIAVVGPTGSGKSMLLSDVESLAHGDTPSGRTVLIDGRAASDEERLSGEKRLVAQLSQNMNFVMDLSVREFLSLHAESRLIENSDKVVEQIYLGAVGLAGEPFSMDTPVTSLSGGQSRALMIADVAYLSASPVVLIDEIENAGVDRRAALDLLVKKEKIVLMATHDPVLAISCKKRIVIKNGGISAILETSEQEKGLLEELNRIDRRLSDLRSQIRGGRRAI